VPAEAGLFTPTNDVAHNLWYWPDIAALNRSAFPGGEPSTLPFIIETDAKPASSPDMPQGGVTRVNLPNRHLEYALTWYGLAGTLIGVYFAFFLGRMRAIAAHPADPQP
jgi:surfeit locus 1 family protein